MDRFGKTRFYKKIMFDTLNEETIAIGIKMTPSGGLFLIIKPMDEG
jgi:hypothetical protein